MSGSSSQVQIVEACSSRHRQAKIVVAVVGRSGSGKLPVLCPRLAGFPCRACFNFQRAPLNILYLGGIALKNLLLETVAQHVRVHMRSFPTPKESQWVLGLGRLLSWYFGKLVC